MTIRELSIKTGLKMRIIVDFIIKKQLVCEKDENGDFKFKQEDIDKVLEYVKSVKRKKKESKEMAKLLREGKREGKYCGLNHLSDVMLEYCSEKKVYLPKWKLFKIGKEEGFIRTDEKGNTDYDIELFYKWVDTYKSSDVKFVKLTDIAKEVGVGYSAISFFVRNRPYLKMRKNNRSYYDKDLIIKEYNERKLNGNPYIIDND